MASVSTTIRDGANVDVDTVTPGDQPETTEHFYDLLGRMDYSVLPNDVVTDYTFDNMDRLDVMRHLESDSDNTDRSDNLEKAKFDYSYKDDNRRDELTETFTLDGSAKTNTYTWVYDEAGRLTSEQVEHWDNTFDQTESYIYDLAGNRLQKTVDRSGGSNDHTTVYDFDANDRMTTEDRYDNIGGTGTPVETTAYTWDRTQQTSKVTTQSAGTSVEQDFVYGLMGQLEQVTTTNKDSQGAITSADRVSYRYDASNLRFIATRENYDIQTSTFVLAGSTEYLVDHQNFTGYGQTVIETEFNSTGQAIKRISYTFGSDEITQTTSTLNPATSAVTGTPETLVFGHDGHGSVRVLFDVAAAVEQVFTYSAFGELLAIHNATAGIVSGSAAALASPSSSLTTHLYNGEAIDTGTGLYNFRARWYNASTARFQRLDPFAGNPQDPFSYNKYGFVHGDPVGMTDPTGMFASLGGAMAGAAIRAGFTSLGIGAVVRVPLFFYEVFIGGKELEAALWDLGTGLASDFAVGAVLGGAGAGLIRFASNGVKLRLAGQSITQFRNLRLPGSLWRIADASRRGVAIEAKILSRSAAFLGRQIKNFPVIDDFIKHGSRGIATSIKSIDLTRRTYQTAGGLTTRLRSSARSLQNFKGASRGTFSVSTAAGAKNQITDKVLVIALEQGAATGTQASTIAKFLREAPHLFPDIKVVLQFIQ